MNPYTYGSIKYDIWSFIQTDKYNNWFEKISPELLEGFIDHIEEFFGAVQITEAQETIGELQEQLAQALDEVLELKLVVEDLEEEISLGAEEHTLIVQENNEIYDKLMELEHELAKKNEASKTAT